jgi:U4/U6 small nuclear ribonucleoprotein PRP31
VRTGFSNIGMQRHAGYIYYSDLVSSVPPDLRVKATRMIAAKCALAARIDKCHESVDGAKGREMLEEIKRKLEKLQEPPPTRNIRALPAPIEPLKKRRGGRRVRKQKEAYAITELQRQQNRIYFGDVENEVSSMDQSKGLGMIGKQLGNIRAAVASSSNKSKYRIDYIYRID